MQLEQCQLVRYNEKSGTLGEPFDEPKVSTDSVCVCVYVCVCVCVCVCVSQLERTIHYNLNTHAHTNAPLPLQWRERGESSHSRGVHAAETPGGAAPPAYETPLGEQGGGAAGTPPTQEK